MSTAVPEVDVTRALALLAGSDARLLDVREDDEWAAGHASIARHMRLGDLDPRQFTESGTVVVTCRSGNRSRTAAAALVDAASTRQPRRRDVGLGPGRPTPPRP